MRSLLTLFEYCSVGSVQKTSGGKSMENKKDLEEIPPNVKRKLNFVLVDHMDQVLNEALG